MMNPAMKRRKVSEAEVLKGLWIKSRGDRLRQGHSQDGTSDGMDNKGRNNVGTEGDGDWETDPGKQEVCLLRSPV